MTPRGSSWRSGFGYRKSSNIYAYTTVKSHDRCTYSIVLTSYLISFMYKTRRCGGITHDNQSEEKNVFRKYQRGCKLQICFPWNCFSWLVQEEPGSSDCSLHVLKFTNYKMFLIKFIEGEQKIHEPGLRPSGNWYSTITTLSLKQRVNRLSLKWRPMLLINGCKKIKNFSRHGIESAYTVCSKHIRSIMVNFALIQYHIAVFQDVDCAANIYFVKLL